MDSYPFELSGGMQQRVGIAAAMFLNPKILMADEPTSALDVTVQKQVIEEMLMVRKTFGTSILLVTHNMGVIRAMADKVLVLHEGEIMEYGVTEEVFEQPQSAYTKNCWQRFQNFGGRKNECGTSSRTSDKNICLSGKRELYSSR